MRTVFVLPLGGLIVVTLMGCHLRAGFGPPPAAPPSVGRTIIRDTVESKDGSKTVTEKNVTITSYEDGRSTTEETNARTVTNPEGIESRTSSHRTTETSANGSVTTSSSSSGN